jgi:hypothetical protein
MKEVLFFLEGKSSKIFSSKTSILIMAADDTREFFVL